MPSKLAIHEGEPIRKDKLPYGRQTLDENDIKAVQEVLQSDWLTTGPKVDEFEDTFSVYVDSDSALAVNNGTAALHTAMYAIGLKPTDEVIVSPITFVSSANCIVFMGAKPVFCDVLKENLLIDPEQVKNKISKRTKAIISIDYAGHPCNYDALSEIAEDAGIALVADCCHSLGAEYKRKKVGSIADLNVFSFHPVKPITTGEGGMITTNNPEYIKRMKKFRNHGISQDFKNREHSGSWFYEMTDLGYNYRLTDIQCALGLSQLKKLDWFTKRRNDIAGYYCEKFADSKYIQPLGCSSDVYAAYHLYVIRLNLEALSVGRKEIFEAMHAEGIGVNVHYIPVHLQPYYQNNYFTSVGDCPVAESAYERILSLPIYPSMTERDMQDVTDATEKVIGEFRL